jgi:hypothetical protein
MKILGNLEAEDFCLLEMFCVCLYLKPFEGIMMKNLRLGTLCLFS